MPFPERQTFTIVNDQKNKPSMLMFDNPQILKPAIFEEIILRQIVRSESMDIRITSKTACVEIKSEVLKTIKNLTVNEGTKLVKLIAAACSKAEIVSIIRGEKIVDSGKDDMPDITLKPAIFQGVIDFINGIQDPVDEEA